MSDSQHSSTSTAGDEEFVLVTAKGGEPAPVSYADVMTGFMRALHESEARTQAALAKSHAALDAKFTSSLGELEARLGARIAEVERKSAEELANVRLGQAQVSARQKRMDEHGPAGFWKEVDRVLEKRCDAIRDQIVLELDEDIETRVNDTVRDTLANDAEDAEARFAEALQETEERLGLRVAAVEKTCAAAAQRLEKAEGRCAAVPVLESRLQKAETATSKAGTEAKDAAAGAVKAFEATVGVKGMLASRIAGADKRLLEVEDGLYRALGRKQDQLDGLFGQMASARDMHARLAALSFVVAGRQFPEMQSPEAKDLYAGLWSFVIEPLSAEERNWTSKHSQELSDKWKSAFTDPMKMAFCNAFKAHNGQ